MNRLKDENRQIDGLPRDRQKMDIQKDRQVNRLTIKGQVDNELDFQINRQID